MEPLKKSKLWHCHFNSYLLSYLIWIKILHLKENIFRRYTNGSWLTSHVDKFNTHVISAILNIDQKVTEDWPLYIKDNNGEGHAVFIKPGQMLWYESARLVHGRPKPLNGEYFDNIFIHYKPVGDWYDSAFIVGHKIRSKPITLKSLKKKKWFFKSEKMLWCLEFKSLKVFELYG